MVKITKNIFLNKDIARIMQVFLILFGLFILFQIVKKILGGSWATEDVIVALLVLNIGTTFTVGLIVAQLKSDHNHLKGQFRVLARDFKQHVEKEK